MLAKDFVKSFTSIPVAFVDELFEMINESTRQTDPVIDLRKVSTVGYKKFCNL